MLSCDEREAKNNDKRQKKIVIKITTRSYEIIRKDGGSFNNGCAFAGVDPYGARKNSTRSFCFSLAEIKIISKDKKIDTPAHNIIYDLANKIFHE